MVFTLGSSVGNDVKWQSAIERALGTWESVNEWADYISFLARVQKAVKNTYHCDGSKLPLASHISEMLARCLEPSLPAGVHQMCIDVYDTVFTILGSETLTSTVNIWLPGLLPVVSWAAFNVKPLIVQLFSTHIVPAISTNATELRELYKPLLLAMLPSIEEENADCFNEICELLATLKQGQTDDSFFWQCFYLCILTSPECRQGSLTLISKMSPNLKESGLFIRAVCCGLEDDNVLVQRGFLDILARLLPLDNDLLQKNDEDKAKTMLSACKTIFRKDMSLNRRLRTWLLGSEPNITQEGAGGLSHLEYLQKYGSHTLIKVLLDQMESDLVGACTLARGLMDRWEIGAILGPALLTPMLLKSQAAGQVDTGSAALFDNIEVSVVWETSIRLLKTDPEVVLFMVENFNITEEEMVKVYIPLTIVYILVGELTTVTSQIVERLLDLTQPLGHPSEPPTQLSPNELHSSVEEFFAKSIASSYSHEEVVECPLNPNDISWYLLKLSGDVVLNGQSASIMNKVLKLFPPTPGLDLSIPQANKIIQILDATTSDDINLFENLMSEMSPEQIRNYVQRVAENFAHNLKLDGPQQFEKVREIWELSESMPNSIMPSALAIVLANRSLSPFERARIFSRLWLYSVDQKNIETLLTKPLLLFLDLSFEDNLLFSSYLQSNIVRTGTTARLIKLLVDKLDLESRHDMNVFTYVLERFIMVLGYADVRAVYASKYAPLMCTLLLEWFDTALVPGFAYAHALELAGLTVLDTRVKDGRIWLRRFVDALIQHVDNADRKEVVDGRHASDSENQVRRHEKNKKVPVSLIKFIASATPLLEQRQDIREFAEHCVSSLNTEVDFEAFTQLVGALHTAEPQVEESLFRAILAKLEEFGEKTLDGGSEEVGDNSCVLSIMTITEKILASGIEYVNSLGDGGSSSTVTGGGLASAFAGFQVESPEDRAKTEKSQSSLLSCLNAVVAQGCKYWLLLQFNKDSSASRPISGKYTSTLQTTGRLKTRIRKIMTLCYNHLPSETLKGVASSMPDFKTAVKMSHMFEGSRYATTLELLMILALEDKIMFDFASEYVNSLEVDALGDVWPIIQQFLTTVTSTPTSSAPPLSTLIFLLDSTLPRFEQLKLKNRKKVVREFGDVFAKVLLSDIKDKQILGKAVQHIPLIFPDVDRQASLLSRLFSLHLKSPADFSVNADLLTKICQTFSVAGTPSARVWTRFVGDFIFETSSQTQLIPLDVSQSIAFKTVIKSWIQCDKERVKDFISKLGTYGSSAVLFGWSGTQDLANLNLLRLAYFKICASPGVLATNWSKLTNQLASMWNQNASSICILLRACLMSQPSSTLMAFMAFRLQSVFQNALSKQKTIGGKEADLLVEACKLIDLALTLGLEQFQQFEWLFISDTGDGLILKPKDNELSTSSSSSSRAGGLLERLVDSPAIPKVPVSEQVLAQAPQFRGKRRPLLPPKATLKDLPIFLSQVSLVSYEEVYALTTPDLEYCQFWLLSDLF